MCWKEYSRALQSQENIMKFNKHSTKFRSKQSQKRRRRTRPEEGEKNAGNMNWKQAERGGRVSVEARLITARRVPTTSRVHTS